MAIFRSMINNKFFHSGYETTNTKARQPFPTSHRLTIPPPPSFLPSTAYVTLELANAIDYAVSVSVSATYLNSPFHSHA